MERRWFGYGPFVGSLLLHAWLLVTGIGSCRLGHISVALVAVDL